MFFIELFTKLPGSKNFLEFLIPLLDLALSVALPVVVRSPWLPSARG